MAGAELDSLTGYQMHIAIPEQMEPPFMTAVTQSPISSQSAAQSGGSSTLNSNAQVAADAAQFFNLYNSGNSTGAANFLSGVMGTTTVPTDDTQSFQYQLLMQIAIGFALQNFATNTLPGELSNLQSV